MGLTAQIVLRITYCYESPARDFEAVAKIKITPRKLKSETIKGISNRRCPDDI